MSNLCMNELAIYGEPEKIREFKKGLLKIDGELTLLMSYIPVPQALDETKATSAGDIAYDLYFNPDTEAYKDALIIPWIAEHGVKTKQQLIEFLKKEFPDSYELALKYQENLNKYGFKNWYDFVEENWGTPHLDFQTKLTVQTPIRLRFEFGSAWSPPLNGLDHIAARFPELMFLLIFEEPVMGFKGFAFWANGKRIDEQFYTIDWTDDEVEGEIT